MGKSHQVLDAGNHDEVLDQVSLKDDIRRHIQSTMGKDPYSRDKYSCFMGLAYSVRDRLIGRWIKTQRACYDSMAKRVYYLSMEFLPGRFLKNYLICLGMEDEAREALSDFGHDLDDIEEEEWDAGLGNGGLGRLASCYMDSMSNLNLPGYGYGIRYDYGIFHQVLVNGYQRETCDNWLRHVSPWEIQRGEQLYKIQFYGRTESYTDEKGFTRRRWVDADVVMAMACDILIPGYRDEYVSNMRLWSARSSREFNLENFNQGDYVGAVEAKVLSENISKVLYPSDEAMEGKELRLRQQYFFVSATLIDIIRRFKKQSSSFSSFPDFVAIQLNDTHPSIAIPELMRLLIDEEYLDWEEAWAICEKTFAYTNHTVLPEALETWPVELINRVLPRHLEIIYEINHRFLSEVRNRYPDDSDIVSRMSLIQEVPVRHVRMAHLAVVGSHSVNGVADLHTRILRNSIFTNFDRFFPGKIKNVTNGITPRRWLCQANQGLSGLITSAIGDNWIRDLDQLRRLIPFADDAQFRASWTEVKRENKKRLARYILRKIGLGVNPDTMFDVHVKRMHEYKRQLLNILHVITLYNRIRDGNDFSGAPRTVFFAGKAAPAYFQAKLIIKLITSVADTINRDAGVNGLLRVIFLPNYCISQAEKVVPAADLSEQISTAGMEASGTGNMKMSLNGALTIGTLDGANVEIMEEVGRENIFIFGLTAEEVIRLRNGGYNPRDYYLYDQELKRVLDMIAEGYFSTSQPGLFSPIIRALLDQGDYFLVLADYHSYIKVQEEVSMVFKNTDDWARRSILNTAQMGKFSSDRAVKEYADKIWQVEPLEV
ncbi:glycogen phosphorylase [uncultured Desulfobacterium sp.]|uniref:Alpha-1,4 glucan phosphorylase n=1 Tax=uncultured Desulfobacterium sp. TaxID=201089 RepID=A0A445MVY5_9BACT|nr:glycogen phosphorylase [uncultured Desulfobacterium sp.]